MLCLEVDGVVVRRHTGHSLAERGRAEAQWGDIHSVAPMIAHILDPPDDLQLEDYSDPCYKAEL